MITKELVEQWAEQAGFHNRSGVIRTVHSNGSWVAVNDELTDFAALAATHGAAQRDAELIEAVELPEPDIWCQENFGLGDISTTIGYSEETVKRLIAAARLQGERVNQGLLEALKRIVGSDGLFAEPASGQHAREIARAAIAAAEKEQA